MTAADVKLPPFPGKTKSFLKGAELAPHDAYRDTSPPGDLAGGPPHSRASLWELGQPSMGNKLSMHCCSHPPTRRSHLAPLYCRGSAVEQE